jgi:mannose-6-phosphate isomerase-like protein (cupin superfamily)
MAAHRAVAYDPRNLPGKGKAMQDHNRSAVGTDATRPYALRRNEGPAVWIVDALDSIKATAEQTGGRFAVIEAMERQGSGPPLHVHQKEDEGYYVLEGQYSFFIGDESIEAPEGTWVYAPKGIPHTFRCESPTGRVLMLIVPGGWEGFFVEAGQTTAQHRLSPASEEQADFEHIARVAGTYGVTILGPPP